MELFTLRSFFFEIISQLSGPPGLCGRDRELQNVILKQATYNTLKRLPSLEDCGRREEEGGRRGRTVNVVNF